MNFLNILDSLFGGGQQGAYQDLANAINQGMHYRQNYFNQADQGMQPYAEAGKSGLSQFQNYLNTLGQHVNNSDWMNGYQESPYAKFQTQEMLKAANQAASASGMLGSGANQENNMKIAQGIASHDMQNYFNNLTQEQGMYQNGLSHLTGMGYGALGQMGNWAVGSGQGIADDYGNLGAAFANKDMANTNIWNNLLSLGITSAGAFL